MSAKELALQAKTRGNAAFTAGKYEEAVTAFTEAIQHDPSDHIFFSNRSGAYASLKRYDEALADADQCIKLKADFAKGYGRKGAALYGLARHDEAIRVYEEGLKIDPQNAQLKEGLADCKRDLERSSGAGGMGGGGANPFGKLFGPDMWTKLTADPVTRAHLNDPNFVRTMNEIQRQPDSFAKHAQDPKVSQALGVLFGLGASAFNARPGAEGDFGDADMANAAAPSSASSSTSKSSSSSSTSSKPTTTTAAEPEPPRELTEEEKKQQEAEPYKEKGNELYKAKKFAEAIEQYSKAIEIAPHHIVYYNNLSAVYFEQKEYDKCIETALKGVEVGRERMASYKDVAKSYARVGNAYAQQKKYAEAIEAFEKSLVEDFNDKVRESLKKAEAAKKKIEAEQYIDPAKSEEHKLKGNTLFQDGKWADAIAEYSEALRRDPSNYKVYSNRAACYTKLMDWQRGLDDCEACLKVDPKFVKAYIRKGKIQHFLKQYHKALETYNKGLEIDPACTELLDSRRLTLQAINSGEADPERAKEAMKDPEIQGILRDPVISKVLQDLQTDPAAGQAALANADIRRKIEKLIAAGILSTK